MTEVVLRYSELFSQQIDPDGETQSNTEQLIATWLFDHFPLKNTDDHALHTIALVTDAFPPPDRETAKTLSLHWTVKGYLQAWRPELIDPSQPDEAESNLAGKDLTLLILQSIHPDYVESRGDEREITAIDLTIAHMKAELRKDYYTGDDEIYETALEGTQLLKALGESSEYPFPFAELPYIPALLFPMKNRRTGKTTWIQIAPSESYGLSITAHKRKPTSKTATRTSRNTSLGGIHIAPMDPEESPPAKMCDPHQREISSSDAFQIRLFDETVAPYTELR